MPYKNKAKQRLLQKRRAASNKDKWMYGKCCGICGSSEKLEVDHINRRHKISHRIWSWSEERRNEELSKCQVLCHKCHKDKHRKDFVKPLIHGTYNAYRYKRCRCDVCRKWNAKSEMDRKSKLR